MKTKAVLFIMNGLRLGGMERQLVELIKALKGSEIMVHLAILNVSGPFSDMIQQYIEQPIIYLDRRKSKILLTIRKIVGIVKDENIDVIHVQDSFSCIYALPVSKWSKVPMINGMIRHAGVSKGFEFYFEKFMLFFSDLIIANSKAGLEYFDIEKGLVLYNIIDRKRFGKTNASLSKIVMNANFHHFKDHLSFFKSMKTLYDLKRVDAIGLIGDGPNREKYEALSREFGLSEIVTFYKHINNVEEVLLNYGIGVLSSTKRYKEGVPNVLLEYMGSGLVAIGSNVGGVPEIIEDGKNGFLFDAEDHESLSRKIIFIQDNMYLLSDIKQAAFQSLDIKHSALSNLKKYEAAIDVFLN